MPKKGVRQRSLEDNSIAARLFGGNGGNLKRIEKELEVTIHARGALLTIQGEEESVGVADHLIEELYSLVKGGYQLYPADIDYAIRMLLQDNTASLENIFLDTVYVSYKKKAVAPKSIAQKRYVDAIRDQDIVFCIGPAGTGKTYLAIAMAVAALKRREVDRIVLTRPAVEAGEKLGFLPGDMAAKVDPYLRPLYDALHEMIGFDQIDELIERTTIEVAPLAFMRGRTLNDSFVIMDEAQNSTPEQMKMFLTRLGMSSKSVVTGDVTQTDLPRAKSSGLVEAQQILKGVEGIEFIHFTEVDVVRHPLVQDIIKAYEAADRNNATD
ncbi:MAG: PhoH family protein [Thermodesulfobacteriota bacterium]